MLDAHMRSYCVTRRHRLATQAINKQASVAVGEMLGTEQSQVRESFTLVFDCDDGLTVRKAILDT